MNRNFDVEIQYSVDFVKDRNFVDGDKESVSMENCFKLKRISVLGLHMRVGLIQTLAILVG